MKKSIKISLLSAFVAVFLAACGNDFSSKTYSVDELEKDEKLYKELSKFCDENKNNPNLNMVQMENCFQADKIPHLNSKLRRFTKDKDENATK